MKKRLNILGLVIVLGVFATSFSACQRKTGCETTEAYKPKVDRHGNLSSKPGKSNLFSKKMQKNQKRR